MYKNFIFIGIAHFFKMSVALAFLKLVAFYKGPEELGYIADFLSFLVFLTVVAGGGILNGLIKNIALYRENLNKLNTFLVFSLAYSFVFSILIAIFIWFFNNDISYILFGDYNYSHVVIFMGFFQFLFAINSFFSGVCNGLGRSLYFSKMQIFSALFALPMVYIFVSKGDLILVLTAACIAYSFLFFSVIFEAPYIIKYLKNIKIFSLLKNASFSDVKLMSYFSIISIVSAVSFPLAEIFIRKLIVNSSSYYYAGLWQGVMKISGAYIGIFSAFFVFYFFPKISSLNDRVEIWLLIKRIMFITASLFVVGGGIFWYFRSFFIAKLLSVEFLGISDFLHYQLFGDFFRLLSYALAYFLLAKAALSICLLLDISQYMLLSFLVYFFHHGENVVLEISKMYFYSYIFYFFVIGFSVFKVLKKI